MHCLDRGKMMPETIKTVEHSPLNPESLIHATEALQLLAKKNRRDMEQAVKEVALAIFAMQGVEPPNFEPQRGPVQDDVG